MVNRLSFLCPHFRRAKHQSSTNCGYFGVSNYFNTVGLVLLLCAGPAGGHPDDETTVELSGQTQHRLFEERSFSWPTFVKVALRRRKSEFAVEDPLLFDVLVNLVLQLMPDRRVFVVKAQHRTFGPHFWRTIVPTT